MKRFLIAVAFAVLAAHPANAQCPDLLDYVKTVFGDDPEARDRRNEPCMYALFAQDKAFWDREILPRVEKALKSEDLRLRQIASAVPMGMAMMRYDSGGEVLSSFLPLLVNYLDDPENKVRGNAALTVIKIVGQTYEPPHDVIEKLAHTAKNGVDNGARVRALGALAQVYPMTPEISKLLVEVEMNELDRLYWFGHVRDMKPEIMAKLIATLQSDDKAVVEASMSAISQLGPTKAKAASSDLRRLAQTSRDKTIAATALQLAERLESTNKK